MTAGLVGILGIVTWTGALILAGVIANVYFLAAAHKKRYPAAIKASNQRRNK